MIHLVIMQVITMLLAGLSLNALTYGSDIFTHTMAGGSVTDWNLYESHYTERFMGTIADNAEGYKKLLF